MGKRLWLLVASFAGFLAASFKIFASVPNGRLDLFDGAGFGQLVGAPTQKFSAVPESIAGEVIVLHFNHQLWFYRLPLRRSLGAPSAWPSGRIAGETRRLDQRFNFLQQGFFF
jgi:hypothetical protein